MLKAAFFGGSKDPHTKQLGHDTNSFGYWMGRQSNVHIMWGGGDMGVMGRFYNGFLTGQFDTASNARLEGHLPSIYASYTNVDRSRVNVIEYESRLERKQALISDKDILFAFPGGVGTFDETWGTIEEATIELVENDRKCYTIFYNHDGFYEGTKIQALTMGRQGYFYKDQLDLLYFPETLDDLISLAQARLQGDIKASSVHSLAALLPK